MPAGVLSFLIGLGRLEAELGIVVTDFHFHAFWITRAFHWYFVAQEEDRIHMEGLGLPGDRIHVTGIPVGPEFMTPVDRGEVLRRYDLDPAQPTLLVAGGALGLSPHPPWFAGFCNSTGSFRRSSPAAERRTETEIEVLTSGTARPFSRPGATRRCRIFWAQPLFCSASLAA
jgi:hypothetical protein